MKKVLIDWLEAIATLTLFSNTCIVSKKCVNRFLMRQPALQDSHEVVAKSKPSAATCDDATDMFSTADALAPVYFALQQQQSFGVLLTLSCACCGMV